MIYDAGYNLNSAENKQIKVFGCEFINIDIAINIVKVLMEELHLVQV